MGKKFIIVGGYGNTGYLIAELLLMHSDSEIIIAGRNYNRAKYTAETLNNMFTGNRVNFMAVDAAIPSTLENAFTKADMAIIASSTLEYVENTAKAAIDTKTDYLDTQLSNLEKLGTLKSLQRDMIEKSLLFITDAGFHPGVPAALIRYAAANMDELYTGNIYSAIKINWKAYSFAESTVLEMVREFKDYKPQIFKNGKWQNVAYKNMPKFNFGEPLGKQNCVAMVMNEFESLPVEIPTLNEAGFYITGFNAVTDYIVTPILMAGLKVLPQLERFWGQLFKKSLQSFNKPPYLTLLNLEADGIKDDKPVHLEIKMSHTDAYYLTAVPVVACLLQYIEGKLASNGLWYQSNIVEPTKFIKDIQELGIKTEINFNQMKKG